ncbi:hypothetical protein ACU6RQ_06085 [Zobellella denitrificans]
MISEEELSSLINESEWMMEGLDKSFWRLIKSSAPELWENKNQDGDEQFWVVALVGNWCIYHSGFEDRFCIGRYEVSGAVEGPADKSMTLQYLVADIIQSRFKIS